MEKELLYTLHKFKDGYISGEELANKFNVTRTSIWNHIDYFRKQGYTIEAHPNLGYRLMNVPDRMLPDEIQYKLNTKIIGKRVFAYEKIGSTNDAAKELAANGEPEGTVVFAECQTKGRGRLKREWFSPAKEGLWFSVILRPQTEPGFAPMFTAISALACAQTIMKETGLSVWIKWPNDIFINDKKAGGILVELNQDLDRIQYVVLGIGINVNIGHFPKKIQKTATSLKIESGRKHSRIELVKEILRSLEHFYGLLKEKKWEEITNEWKNMSMVPGRRVVVVQGEEKIEAQALEIDRYGALIVRLDSGITKHITSGDIICC